MSAVSVRASRLTLLVGAAVAAGLAVRIWILASPLGALESDEAITGLMARRVLHGDISVFYWLSNYGGSGEALLTAPLFALFGSSVVLLKLVPIALFALAALLAWRVGLRTVGEPAARLAAALYWLWPGFLVFWTTKARAYYGSTTALGLAGLLLVLRLRERDSRADAALLGLAFGLGWWMSPQILVYAVPSLLWLAWRRPAALRLAWAGVPTFLLGAAPYFAYNVKNHWEGLFPGAVAGAHSTYLGRLAALFRDTLPEFLGLRLAFTRDWAFGPLAGIALLVVALAAFALLLARRPRRMEPLLAIALAFPFLYAASSFAYFREEPRYLIDVAPIFALLLAPAIARAAPVALALAAAATVATLVAMQNQGYYEPFAGHGHAKPLLFGPLIRELERERVTRVEADYWIAYRLSFESRERIRATSTGFVRDVPTDLLVRASPHPARVYVRGAPDDRVAGPRLLVRGYRRVDAGGFAAYIR